MTKPHKCAFQVPQGDCGAALSACFEVTQAGDPYGECEPGQFWISNGEYASQVNFCPFCGRPATTWISDEDMEAIEWEPLQL